MMACFIWSKSRIIPARAGFTGRTFPERFLGVDHPRACGVYVNMRFCEDYVTGSSPRVRGLLNHNLRITDKRRIIPARAGFTVTLRVIM